MMRFILALIVAAGITVPAAMPSQAREICTVILDASTRETLLERGDCTTPVTPASTFKIPLALIGFDSGVLVDPQTPELAFTPGDPDWGDRWAENTDPSDWMRYSVLWYSQRITHALGAATMTDYLRALNYGNADMSGDAGFDNGLERAWVSSSLAISPRDQAAFLVKLLARDLPVSTAAYENTFAIIDAYPAADGWTLRGKTGGAYPRNANRSFDYTAGWGWFVGWAERDGRTVVFAQLNQDRTRLSGSPGTRARDAFVAAWPQIAAPL